MFGSLIFVSGLLVSYMLYVIYNSDLDTMQNKISSLAYTDPLTGLANRARCEQVMEMLTSEHGSYTIISLDLNKLKEVNDNLGHHEGDRLIAGFATILSDSFWDANLVGRMGGDEFNVILRKEDLSNMQVLLEQFDDKVKTINEEANKPWEQVWISKGFAVYDKTRDKTTIDVMKRADDLMYENKRMRKAARK
jgi:diguanylate cyclase (GGDEF)-like protein